MFIVIIAFYISIFKLKEKRSSYLVFKVREKEGSKKVLGNNASGEEQKRKPNGSRKLFQNLKEGES